MRFLSSPISSVINQNLEQPFQEFPNHSNSFQYQIPNLSGKRKHKVRAPFCFEYPFREKGVNNEDDQDCEKCFQNDWVKFLFLASCSCFQTMQLSLVLWAIRSREQRFRVEISEF